MNSIPIAYRGKFRNLFLAILLGGAACSKDPNNSVADAAAEFVIEFSGNGHTSGTPPIAIMTDKRKTTITLPGQGSLLKEGFIFNGWNTSQNGGGRSYLESDILAVPNTDVRLYAQWLNEIAYHTFVPSNVSRIDIRNVVPLPQGQWYYASVDVVNGSLTLNDGQSSAKFQFQYNAESNAIPENYGFLRISQQPGFRTATNHGKVQALAQGTLIAMANFDPSDIAEISGELHNWGNLSHVFIPALITITNKPHFGYIDVSYNDINGQLTIHATAYQRLPNKGIMAGDTGI